MIQLQRTELPNGLKVVVNRDPTTSMAAMNILYNVGARDEKPSRTGMAHLFEHLMFGGSANIPDYDAPLELAGGWSNAWTSNDFTSFYDVLPAANIATAFWLESDRMFQLALTPRALEIQRSVVLEEFKQTCLNKPYGDMAHHLRSLAYTTHPYRYPTIGLLPDHIKDMTLEEVQSFYTAHYSPSNAILAISGNVDPDHMFELAYKWFGPIPKHDIAPRLYLPEPAVTTPRRAEVTAAVPQTRIVIAFPMGAYTDLHYIPADLITDILASGRSSRLNRLVMSGRSPLTAADASILGSEEPGLLMVSGRVDGSNPKDIARAEQLLWEQINNFADSGAENHELERVLNRFESNHTFSQLSYLQKVQNIAMAEMHGENINRLPERYRAVTTDSIHCAAHAILNPEHACTLIYKPIDRI